METSAAASTGGAASRGVFIAFEGIDGSGKTTQARLLAEWLGRVLPGGRAVVSIREPGSTRLGEEVRTLLSRHGHTLDAAAQTCLFSAARADMIQKIVRPALGRGDIVVSDRYVMSTLAYQAPRWEGAEPVALAVARDTLPDVTVWLRLPPETAVRRIRARGDESGAIEDPALHRLRDVHAAYERLALARFLRVVEVDGGGAEEVVAARVREAVRPILASRGLLKEDLENG